MQLALLADATGRVPRKHRHRSPRSAVPLWVQIKVETVAVAVGPASARRAEVGGEVHVFAALVAGGDHHFDVRDRRGGLHVLHERVQGNLPQTEPFSRRITLQKHQHVPVVRSAARIAPRHARAHSTFYRVMLYTWLTRVQLAKLLTLSVPQRARPDHPAAFFLVGTRSRFAYATLSPRTPSSSSPRAGRSCPPAP